MKGKYIPKKSIGRRFAIGDIHGCYKTFHHLVTQVLNLQKQDQLFLLGDYVHRGPEPIRVLDFILQLQAENYSVYALRGNHEEMMMEKYEDNLVDPYRDFLFNLPYYFETSDYLFVHAAFNFRADEPFEDYHSMLWSRNHESDEELFETRRIVYGHTVNTLSSIKKAVENREPLIPLDNGCYKGTENAPLEIGNLCALDLDTFTLYIEPNREKK